MTKYTVYRVTDEGGALYESPGIVSRHRSLKQAVTSACKSAQYALFRDKDDAEFTVDYRKYGHGDGTWIDINGGTIEQNVRF